MDGTAYALCGKCGAKAHNPDIDCAPTLPYAEDRCYWTGKVKGQCGCTGECPNCGRKQHDSSVEKCYLC